MKKLKLLVIMVVLSLVACLSFSVVSASADEIIAEQTTETTEETEPTTIESVKQELKDLIDRNIQDGRLKDIIYLVLFGGVGTALIGVYVKYRRYKHNTLEDVAKTIHNDLTKFFTDKFNDLSAEKIQPLIECLDSVDNSLETMMKVLVLMQDKTAEGKVALLEFLGAKTENKAIKESVAEVKESIEQEQKTAQEVNSKVKDEYSEIKVF